MPAHGFQVFRHGKGAAHVGPHRTPQIAEALAGMAILAAPVAGGGHARVVFGFRGAAGLQAEEHGAHRILAVGRVAADEGFVFAVGDRALVDIIGEEVRAALDRTVNLRIDRLPACEQRLLAHDNGHVGDDADRVDRAVAGAHAAAGAIGSQDGRAVTEGAIDALGLGELERVAVDAGQHIGIARCQVILGEKQALVGPVPDWQSAIYRTCARQRAGIGLQAGLHRGVIGIARLHSG